MWSLDSDEGVPAVCGGEATNLKGNAMTSRYSEGGFTERFSVVRLDGKATRPSARYIVLDYSGADPHAVVALRSYADSVESENQQFAEDIRAAIANPHDAPAQHPCADNK